MIAYFTGLAVGAQLILAIGAQNAFVLRQGLRREHVLAICVTCSLSDLLLIAVGVSSFAAVEARFPAFAPILLWVGSAFLIVYGLMHLRDALRGGAALRAENGATVGLRTTLLTCLALTWLNPHVYLDTVVLLGALSTQFNGQAWLFGLGAATASTLFFFALGYGARLLSPLFARPRAWQVLDAVVGLTMLAIAAKLLIRGFA